MLNPTLKGDRLSELTIVEHSSGNFDRTKQQVAEAWYGARVGASGSSPGTPNTRTSEGEDVTAKVQELLRAGKTVQASNALFGDTAPGKIKVLEIKLKPRPKVLEIKLKPRPEGGGGLLRFRTTRTRVPSSGELQLAQLNVYDASGAAITLTESCHFFSSGQPSSSRDACARRPPVPLWRMGLLHMYNVVFCRRLLPRV